MEFVVKGGDAPTPVVFGDYEIGRSRFDRGGGYLTAPFRDNMPQHRAQHEEHWRLWGNVGDPGTYDPRVTRQNLASANLAAKKFMSSSETRPAFDSTSQRQFTPREQTQGRDAPSRDCTSLARSAIDGGHFLRSKSGNRKAGLRKGMPDARVNGMYERCNRRSCPFLIHPVGLE